MRCSARRAGPPGVAVERRGRDRGRRRGGSSGRASDGDPLGLGQPDREVRDDRARGCVERVPDRSHPSWPSSSYALRGAARAGTERRQQRDREEQRSRRCRGGRRARRPAASSPAAPRPRRCAASRASRADRTSRTWTGAGGVEERAPRRRHREDQARDQERDASRRAPPGGSRGPATAHGSAMKPITEIGRPGNSRTLKRLCAKPSTRISSSRAGPTAR